MFRKLLIANRGEIALRIIYACRELGIRTVIAHSQADEHSLPVRFADEEVCIGPARSQHSYLNVPAVITAAEMTGADAIHPGYGFLSESAYLAEACAACSISFVGPPAGVLRLLGDKAQARRAMRKAGLPVVPGTDSIADVTAARRAARRLGYPVIIKATSGGGGRGMRIVQDPDELEVAFLTARREAEAAFGDPRVYLEIYVEDPRHIEFQVLADDDGATVHLGERECTLQRRHQKVLEETPSIELSDRVRLRMGKLVTKAARAVGYVNAGTFEFLLDGRGRFYFMEANARLQVEHPITEMVTGVDIVKEQIRIASGDGLSIRQADVRFTGHAIECRVNAEHPETFAPSPGLIRTFSLPGGPGIRVDTFAHAGCTVPPHYDSLVAKVIAHGRDRVEAIDRMRRALEMTVVEGIETTIPLHLRILEDPDFLDGRFTTAFLERFVPETLSSDSART
jgi:acetyl-CoA carboxylase biotin carboxylase subunit